MFKFSSLAAIYASFILDGDRTIDQVPDVLRDQVNGILGVAKNSTSTDGDTSAQA